MKTISKILSVVLCLSVIIGLFVVGASAADTYVKVTDGNLTSGEYVIVCSNGVAMGKLDGTWITTANPTISGDNVTDAKGAVWTLTVDGDKVTIADANGAYIKPKAGNTNGIESGSYSWQWTFANGEFTFAGTGSDTTLLASNVGSDNKFRSYKTSTVGGNAAGYPSTFTLYKKGDAGSVTPPATEATTPSTEATTPSTEATTPAAPTTDLVVIDTPVVGTAYKFGMVQQNVTTSPNLYFLKGGMNGYYMDSSNDPNAAIDVYLEETTGGYYLYTLENGAKLYINMVVSGTHVNGAYEATASTIYRYDATSKTLIAVVNDTDYWFGTRNDNTYTTVGPCATSYNGFYCQFYGVASTPDASEPSTEATTPVAPAPTGDTSVISVAAAALVLAALGGTILVIKKREN